MNYEVVKLTRPIRSLRWAVYCPDGTFRLFATKRIAALWAQTTRRAEELRVPREIEPQTAALWLSLGTITKTDEGTENTYYTDTFGNEFFVKDYPGARRAV